MVLTYISVCSSPYHRDCHDIYTDIVEALAARTAYAIGLHRTEVNASFGAATHNTRCDSTQASQTLQTDLACRTALLTVD